MLYEVRQGGVTKQHQIGHDVSVSAGGLVFKEARVFAPVEPVFYTAPMATNGLKPLFRASFFSLLAAQIVTGFP